jgi:spore germination protein KC
MLHTEGVEVVLPTFHNAENHGKPVTEVNGTAIYKGERLIGFLTPRQSKYYLFVMDKVAGGVLTCSSTGQGEADTTLEISKSSTQRSFEYKNGRLTVVLKVETDTYLNEANAPLDFLDEARIGELERLASEKLVRGIADTVETVQTQYNSDIFGFGDMIHKKDPKLWNMLKGQWDGLFPALEVRIECKVEQVSRPPTGGSGL